MDIFDYLSVLFSVILGLAVTQILQGLRALLLARSRVKIYWPAVIWAVLMILIVAQAWCGMFGMRDFREWNFAMYAVVVYQITLMYLTAGLALPDVPPEGEFDMREAYYAHSRWFFGLLALTVTATFLKDYVTIGHIGLNWNTAFLATYFLFSAVAALTKAPWYHWFLAPFSAVIVTFYAFTLSFRL